MHELDEETRFFMGGLLKEIIQKNPPLTHLNLSNFCDDKDGDQSSGQIILEALFNSSICTIQDLNLSHNSSWFNKVNTGEDREGALEMLTEVISNQSPNLQILNLGKNSYSSVNTEKLLTGIAECGICSTLKEF